MNTYLRFVAALSVSFTCLEHPVFAFKSIWISQFWPSSAVQGNLAFPHNDVLEYLKLFEIYFRPVPPARHRKKVVASKHGVTRSIFLRLTSRYPMQVVFFSLLPLFETQMRYMDRI